MLKQTEQPPSSETFLNVRPLTDAAEQALRSDHKTVIQQEGTAEEWASMINEGDRLFLQARHSQYAHYDEHKALDKLHRGIGFWAAILAGMSGASVLSRVGDIPSLSDVKVYIEVVQGLVALAAATLTTIQTKGNFSKLSEEHRISAADYGAFRRGLHLAFHLPVRMRRSLSEYFEASVKELDRLAAKSPAISKGVWKNIEQRMKDDPSKIMDDKTDDPV